MGENENVEVLSEVPVEKKVRLIGSDGQPGDFTVREMSPSGFMDWLEASKASPNGKPHTERQKYEAGYQEKVDLISCCVFDAQGQPVAKDRVRAWGVGTVNRLAAICTDVNKLTGKA